MCERSSAMTSPTGPGGGPWRVPTCQPRSRVRERNRLLAPLAPPAQDLPRPRQTLGPAAPAVLSLTAGKHLARPGQPVALPGYRTCVSSRIGTHHKNRPRHRDPHLWGTHHGRHHHNPHPAHHLRQLRHPRPPRRHLLRRRSKPALRHQPHASRTHRHRAALLDRTALTSVLDSVLPN
jgi:hypothetical protein